MQSENMWKIPASFLYPPLYLNKDRFHQLESKDIIHIISDEPFYFDMLFFLDEKLQCHPWEKPKDFVPLVFDEWKKLKGIARETFKQKGKNEKTERLLIHCISLFIICLFWSNKAPVMGLHPSDLELTTLQRKPINCKERLLFIISKPTQYHAFIQLEQLFSECEKLFAKAIALKQI